MNMFKFGSNTISRRRGIGLLFLVIAITILLFFPFMSHVKIEGMSYGFNGDEIVDEKVNLSFDAWIGTPLLGKDSMSAHVSLSSGSREEILLDKTRIEGIGTYLFHIDGRPSIRRFDGAFYNANINGYQPIGGALFDDGASMLLFVDDIVYVAPAETVRDARRILDAFNESRLADNLD